MQMRCEYLKDTGEISGSGQKLFHCEVRNMNIGAEATICPCRFFMLKDPTASTSEEMTQDQAQRIINALQIGVPPAYGIDVFGCGQQKALVSTQLQEVLSGFSRSLFVVGDYGTGKSHLLQFIFNQALDNDFAVSKVSIKPECNFSKEMDVYSELMRNLTLPDNKEVDGIDWLSRKVGRMQLPPSVPQNIALAFEKAADYRGQKRRILLDYICGMDVPVSQFRNLVQLPMLKIKLENDDFKPLIKGMTEICLRDYSGLVLLFDEVENIIQSNVTYLQTQKALNNIVRIIDSIPDLRSIYLVFGVTPEVFDILKKNGATSNKSSSSSTTIKILSVEDLIALAQQIREIHSIAFDSKAKFKKFDITIERIAKEVTAQHLNVREFVKTVVSVLDSE